MKDKGCFLYCSVIQLSLFSVSSHAMEQHHHQTPFRDSMEDSSFALLAALDPGNSPQGSGSVKVSRRSNDDNNDALQIFFDAKEKKSYDDFKKSVQRAATELTKCQNTQHNPLIRAVQARDIDFIQFLLEHKADPLFRGESSINAFDAFNIQTSEDFTPYSFKVATQQDILLLLKQYCKSDDVYSPFPFKGIRPGYKEVINIEKWFQENSYND